MKDLPGISAFHNQIFDQDDGQKSGLYDASLWTKLTRSGHERRMRILDELDVGTISDKTALDFGTGPWGFGCVFPRLREARLCVGMDVSEAAIRAAVKQDDGISHKSTHLLSDGEAIPVEDDTIDIFWGGEVIEHVREPRLFMQEIARIGRPGSLVLLSTPNRDAVLYRAQELDYSIGPEHIALMNYLELRTVLELFLINVEVWGYETSLHPLLDNMAFSEAELSTIQMRSFDHPEIASGLVARGYVSKELYNGNRRDWRLEELSWSSPVFNDSPPLTPMSLFGKVLAGGLLSRCSLRARVRARKLVLLFWGHSWSGVVSITFAGETRLVDLFSNEGGFKRVEFILEAAEESDLNVARIGEKRPGSYDDQVIFYKALSYCF